MELCPGSVFGEGFQLFTGLAEIHVPRMWVEEDEKEHHVRGEGGGRVENAEGNEGRRGWRERGRKLRYIDFWHGSPCDLLYHL